MEQYINSQLEISAMEKNITVRVIRMYQGKGCGKTTALNEMVREGSDK